jgi:hypothetical protein
VKRTKRKSSALNRDEWSEIPQRHAFSKRLGKNVIQQLKFSGFPVSGGAGGIDGTTPAKLNTLEENPH